MSIAAGTEVLVLLNGRLGQVLGPSDALYQRAGDGETVYDVLMLDDKSIVQAGESSLQVQEG